MKNNAFTNTKNSNLKGASKNLSPILKLIVLLQFIFNGTYGQVPISKYLTKPISQYSLSANNEDSKTDYYRVEKTYSIQKPLNEVWNFYNTVNTKVAWHSKISKYLLSYDKPKGLYNNVRSASFDTLKKDKVFLLELTFLRYIKIPVIFQITKIDANNKIIEFTYMKENKSNGFQRLEFSEKNGVTIIKHISYYRSGNKLRDRFIYPKFHIMATDDFHRRLFKLLKNRVRARKAEVKNTLLAGSNCENEEPAVLDDLIQK